MSPTKKQIFILLAATFAFKLVLGLYFSRLTTCETPLMRLGYIAVYDGDTFSYLGAIDNLLEQGRYFFWNGTREVYAGRMPFYGIPYFFLRLFFGQSAAYDIIVVLQIFLDSLATVVFARLCLKIVGTKTAFWLGYAVYMSSFNNFNWSMTLNAESLSVSFLVFFLYFFHLFWAEEKWSNAVSASIFLALLTALKPYLVLLYPAFFLGAIFAGGKITDFPGARSAIRKTFILSLPLLFLLTPWIVRNAIVLRKFVPAQENIYAGYNYSAAFIALTDFTSAWGGDLGDWNPNDAGCYFSANPPSGCDFKPPQYALTSEYNADDIERIRRDYLELQKKHSPELEQKLVSELERYTESYRREKPLMYYAGAKFIIVKKMFWHTNNAALPIQPKFKCYDSFQLSFKVIQFAVYICALSFGAFGLIKSAAERNISLALLAFPVILVFLFAELRTTQARYISHIYIILLLGIPAAFNTLITVLKLGFKKSRTIS